MMATILYTLVWWLAGITLYTAFVLATKYVVKNGAPSAHKRHEILMKSEDKQ